MTALNLKRTSQEKHNKISMISSSICVAGLMGMALGIKIDNFNVGFLSGLVSEGAFLIGVIFFYHL